MFKAMITVCAVIVNTGLTFCGFTMFPNTAMEPDWKQALQKSKVELCIMPRCLTAEVMSEIDQAGLSKYWQTKMKDEHTVYYYCQLNLVWLFILKIDSVWWPFVRTDGINRK